MGTIARRAGIGTATLHRRFPTKDHLIAAVYADQYAHCVAVVDEALADPDPWRGFCHMVNEICVLQTADRTFTDAFLAKIPDTSELDDARQRTVGGLFALVARAKAVGRLRADFVPADLALSMAAVSGLAARYPRSAADTARRLAAYLLAAFAADHHGPELPPSPLTSRHLFEAAR
ncbi:hypothetical protein Asi02nite_72440 [Asanoa siamensis]|uniref:HTH tetR-type domain-containing protein n=1 Tax=Asanoa siamensis TaxID=926357 RepID=A0ABQ4D2G5_9ACTN|nr:hypothetical protein Asi02nite_72440 [Asanoa siamensis]